MYPLALEQLKPCREIGFNMVFRLLQKSASSPYCRSGSIPPLLLHKTSFCPCRVITPRAFFSANANIQTAEAIGPKLGFVVNRNQNLQCHKTEHTASQHPQEKGNDVPEEARNAGLKSKVEIQHPWPEWISLMEHLVEKNYFESPAPSDENAECSSTSDMFKDFNLVKTACLNFARDRSDILRSLSREDIKAVVEYGCHNTNRKVVNSGKRLRAYVNLDEAVVCGMCNLRGSCNRADIKPHQGEDARMDDIMRVLLTYGLDPLVGSAVNELHMRETIIASVRKLLKEAVQLSATPLDPNFPRPKPEQPFPRKKQSPPVLIKRAGITDVEMKKGDWLCPRCNIVIFARNTTCIKCNERRPKEQLQPGEWECPACDFLNFGRNMICLKCDCKRPKDEHMQNTKHGQNDYRTDAMSAFQQSQKLQNPGDWECPVCKFKNFRTNMTCLKCDCKRPKDEDTHNSRLGWNDHQTDATGDFQQSKHLEHKLTHPVKTANSSKAQNDEYDHGSISDDDLLNSARRSKGLGINDGNFDFADIPGHEGKSGTTVGRRKEWNEKKHISLRSSSAKENHFSHLVLDDDDDDSNWNKEIVGRVSDIYGRDSTSARGKGRVHNYDDTDDEDGQFGSDQRKESESSERSSFSKQTRDKSSFKNFGDLDEDDDNDDLFGSEDDQPRASRSKLRGGKARSSDRGKHRVQSRRGRDPSSASQVSGSEANDDDFHGLNDLIGSEDEQPQASRSKLRGEEARSYGRREYITENRRTVEPCSASRVRGRREENDDDLDGLDDDLDDFEDDDPFDKTNEGEKYGKSKVGKAERNKARNGVTRSR